MEKTQQDSVTRTSQQIDSKDASATEEIKSKSQETPHLTSEQGAGSGDVPIEFSLDDLSFSEDHLELVDAANIQKTRADAQLVENLNSIPDKMAFKIGEAAELLGVKQYVLRYWETEFEALRPKKSKNNQRVYARKDVETAMLIKKLLYVDRFSIEGARAALKQLKSQVKDERNWYAVAQGQQQIVEDMRELIAEIRRVKESFA